MKNHTDKITGIKYEVSFINNIESGTRTVVFDAYPSLSKFYFPPIKK
jgi:hypothetical protein